MFDPRWLDEYEDVGEHGVIQFAASCPICSARYLSASVEAGSDPVATAAEAFAAFDTAYREIVRSCPSCGQLACPCCWESGRQMCLRCAGGHRRSGAYEPLDAALADGRLVLSQIGIYDTTSAPLWMQALLSVRIRGQVLSDSLRRTAGRWSIPLRSSQKDDLLSYPLGATSRYSPSRSVRTVGNDNEVSCPVCEAQNYDFATYCRNCGARLLERCTTCGEVNAVGAERCIACDAVVNVQRQEVVLERPATYYSPREVRRKTYATTSLQRMPAVERGTTSPLAKKRRRGALREALAERPPTVLQNEVLENRTSGPLGRLGVAASPAPVNEATAAGPGSAATLLFFQRLGRAFGRLCAAFLWVVVVPGCFIVLASSELSPTVNDVVHTLVHIDVRADVAGFLHSFQLFWQFIHN